MTSANDVAHGTGANYGAERTRYLVEILKLTTSTVKVKVIHNMVKNMFDLKPYDTTVTLRLSKDIYDSTLMAFMAGQPTVIEVLNGRVLGTFDTEEAEVRPLRPVQLQPEETSDSYATIYTARTNVNKISQKIGSMTFHWSHDLKGERHTMTLADSIEIDTSHCKYCATIKLRKSAVCKKCSRQGINPEYNVAYELLGMVKLQDGSISSGGEFSVSTDAGGQRLVIQCKGFTVKTDLDEIQGVFEKWVSAPDQADWNGMIPR